MFLIDLSKEFQWTEVLHLCVPAQKDCPLLLFYEGVLYPCGFIKFFITEINTWQTEQQKDSAE